jgi:hypothetical protein
VAFGAPRPLFRPASTGPSVAPRHSGHLPPGLRWRSVARCGGDHRKWLESDESDRLPPLLAIMPTVITTSGVKATQLSPPHHSRRSLHPQAPATGPTHRRPTPDGADQGLMVAVEDQRATFSP